MPNTSAGLPTRTATTESAANWLALASNASYACPSWLKSKLLLREGKLAEAEKSMAKGWETLRDSRRYTGWVAPPAEEDDTIDRSVRDDWTFEKYASGDLGVMQLARADFTRSLDTFLNGDLWPDTAYVAERVLTADELKAYVTRQPPVAEGAPDNIKARSTGLTYLLGRRLVREDRYQEAKEYLPDHYDKYLANYLRALADGANEKLPKARRARAWFDAAWSARFVTAWN